MLEKQRDKRYDAATLVADIALLQDHLLTGAPLKSERRGSVFSGGTGLFDNIVGLFGGFRRRSTAAAAPRADSVGARPESRSASSRSKRAGSTTTGRPRPLQRTTPAAAEREESAETTEIAMQLEHARELQRNGQLAQARELISGLIARLGQRAPELRREAIDLLGQVERYLLRPTDLRTSSIDGRELTQALLLDSRVLSESVKFDPTAAAQRTVVLLKAFVDNLIDVEQYTADIAPVRATLLELDFPTLAIPAQTELSAQLLRLALWLDSHKAHDEARRWLWFAISHSPVAQADLRVRDALVAIEGRSAMILIPGMRLELDYPVEGAPTEVATFLIDRQPVTVAMYQQFLCETGYPSPPGWRAGQPPPNTEQHPVTQVNYFDASAFAQWAGKRLPSEFEWEVAARGPLPRRYPWDGEFEEARANTRASGWGSTAAVEEHGDGASPYGCLDMCGNVWEWTESWFDRDRRERVLRGGSYFTFPEYATTNYRYYEVPQLRRNTYGFRCARSFEPPRDAYQLVRRS
jgi:formylglycine-generating enzyme required for sulfatase activity